MKNYLIITFILLILAFVSFLYRTYPLNEEKRKLKHVLEQSKENRSEIKKVLDHYKKGSLHYKSAIYLIQNLPGHSYYTNTPSKEFREILEIAHSSFYDNNSVQRNLKIREAWDSIQSKKNISRIHSWNRKKDINTIKANYLIPHINKSIEAWKSAWGAHLSFKDLITVTLLILQIWIQSRQNTNIGMENIFKIPENFDT